MYDCDGLWFCNNEPDFNFDCYVNNQFCEDFNGDGIVDAWVGDGWCDDGEWGYDFQCEEYSFDCGDCGDEYSDNYGYCSHILEESEFYYEGINRKYYLYEPHSIQDNAPLIFMLHGYGGSATSIINYSKMNAVADEHGFAVCYPQGVRDQYNNRFWNVGYAFHDNQTVDDVGFLSSLAQHLSDQNGYNYDNIFSTGMSNGGDMSYMLACEAHDVFRAIAPVAGCMMESVYNNCDSFSVPVLEIHGTDDNVTLWAGDMENNDGWGAYLSTLDGINYWVETNNCIESEDIALPNIDLSDGSHIIKHRKFNCNNNSEVWLYEVVNGGHDWPGSDGNMDIDSSVEIWRFFNQFTFILGDLNADDFLNILDVIILVQIILGQSQDNVAGDINQDGIYNIIDVIQLVNIILNNL
tara:strand:+ start:1026 stop:2249 length:1224 start_codon:yes stop_codon:yes gene_type:complete